LLSSLDEGRSALSNVEGQDSTSASSASSVVGQDHMKDKGPFSARVLSVVRRIPPGRVATYGDVAALAGRPGAARAVGNVMRDCHRPDVPCHRVIAAGGRLGGYGGSEVLKRSLLMAEGIVVSGSRVRELDRVQWAGEPNRYRKKTRKQR
jgi:O-6-methylguanine DNA methyltransferase